MRIINLLIIMVILVTSCTSSKKCSCFKNAKKINQLSFVNEFDSIFQNNYHQLNFNRGLKQGSISQVLFLEIDLAKKDVFVITSNDDQKKNIQSKYFKKYMMKLFEDFDYALNSDEIFVIPILIHKVDSNLNKTLEEEDCRYYHKKLRKYNKSNIKLSREVCFASSGRFS